MKNIAIIGAGVAGLSAAIELQKRKIPFTIYEADVKVGGRMKTDEIDGFLLDHGFQVLLTGYPLAQEMLDYESLNLKNFFPGAKIYLDKKWKLIGDPMRNPESLFSTLASGMSTLSDNLKILKLKNQLKNSSVNEIFLSEESSTLEFLRNYGFSDKMIDSFFKPFFSGIFLESELSTSSRMFSFVFKMFSEGFASLPAEGIKAIPEQLAEKVGLENIAFEHRLTDIGKSELVFENGEQKKHDIVINAINWSAIDPLKKQNQEAHQVLNLYFSSDESIDSRGILYLNPSTNSLINNIAFPDAVQSSYASKGKHLISVSILDAGKMSDSKLLEAVLSELHLLFGNVVSEWDFLKQYSIPKALPQKPNIDIPVNLKQEYKGIEFIQAGDIGYYGSLNAALLSGKRAAKAILA